MHRLSSRNGTYFNSSTEYTWKKKKPNSCDKLEWALAVSQCKLSLKCTNCQVSRYIFQFSQYFFSSEPLKYYIHIEKCINLKCMAWWIFTKLTHSYTVRFLKRGTISVTRKLYHQVTTIGINSTLISNTKCLVHFELCINGIIQCIYSVIGFFNLTVSLRGSSICYMQL